MPTKTLVASAYAAHLARRAADFGVVIDGAVRVDMRRVKQRKDEVAQRASRNVEQWLKGTANLSVIEGHARFVSPDTVRVNGRDLRARRIFVNVGGRALVPAIPGLKDVPYFTNSTLMDVDFVPEHLVVLGGSYIGLEFAQAYRRFGSRVTVVEKLPRIIGREDVDVSETVRDVLRNEDITVETGAECFAVRQERGEVVIRLDCEAGAREVRGSHLLLAVGRIPNTDDLGLDRAGVVTDRNGFITVDDELRTNV